MATLWEEIPMIYRVLVILYALALGSLPALAHETAGATDSHLTEHLLIVLAVLFAAGYGLLRMLKNASQINR